MQAASPSLSSAMRNWPLAIKLRTPSELMRSPSMKKRSTENATLMRRVRISMSAGSAIRRRQGWSAGELTGLFELGKFLVEMLQRGLQHLPIARIGGMFHIVQDACSGKQQAFTLPESLSFGRADFRALRCGAPRFRRFDLGLHR